MASKAGWKMIPAVHKICDRFSLDIRKLNMTAEKVLHPSSTGSDRHRTFNAALADGHAVCTSVYSEFVNGQFTLGHAMPIVSLKDGDYIFKNSDGGGIPLRIGVLRETFQILAQTQNSPEQQNSAYKNETDIPFYATKFLHEDGYAIKIHGVYT